MRVAGKRSVLLASTLFFLIVGCEQPGYELKRPWLSDSRLEVRLVSLGSTTKPAVELETAGKDKMELPLGKTAPGILTTSVGVNEVGDWSVGLRMRPGDAACQIDFGGSTSFPAWRECRLPVTHWAKNATLELRFRGPVPHTVFLSSPLLASAQRPARPPVFVLIVDALRADRLVTYVPSFPLGFAIDRLARDSIAFEQMRSSSSWTRPAVATLLTGLSPQTHKVHDRPDLLPGEIGYLPAMLQGYGYETAAWSANPNILPLWGFARGFDMFVDSGALRWVTAKSDSAEVFNQVRAHVLRRRGEPVLYYVHLMDTHSPYLPDERHLAQVRDDPRLSTSLPVSAAPGARAREEYLRYLGEIADVDEEIGSFLDFLRGQGMYDNAVVLLLSDHGEEFLDHGGQYHGRTLYEEMLRVPAILKLPGGARAGTRLKGPTTLADLMPTLLHFLGIPLPDGLDGRVLSPAEPTHRTDPPVAILKLEGRHLTSIADAEWKLIVDHHGTESLFHLSSDPGERSDLSGSHVAEARRLRALLDGILARRQAGWHVLACGGAGPASIRMTLIGSGESIRTDRLEPEDRVVEEEGGKVALFLNLDQHRVRREFLGRILEQTVQDEDEIIVTLSSVSRPPELLFANGELSYTLGATAAFVSAERISFAQVADTARVRASDAVSCFPLSGPRAGSVPARPYLRVWLVPAAEALAETAIAPAVLERLKALGYGAGEATGRAGQGATSGR